MVIVIFFWKWVKYGNNEKEMFLLIFCYSFIRNLGVVLGFVVCGIIMWVFYY